MEQARALRSFHNRVKHELISQYAQESGATSMLDIGTGRGGDMHKWHKVGLTHVVGVDVCVDYIHEAIRRYKQCKHLRNRMYKFYYTTEEKVFLPFLKECCKPLKYDMVSCMFAFHYFFKTQESLNSIMRQVSEVLNPNGYFVCVSPMGESINALLKDNTSYQSSVFHVTRLYDTPKGIGDAIQFMLMGTLYFGENMISNEYLIFKNTIELAANAYGLKLVEYKGFDKFYKDSDSLTQETQLASFLNGAIVFKKVAS